VSTQLVSSVYENSPETAINLLVGLKQRISFSTDTHVFQVIEVAARNHPLYFDLLDRCLSIDGLCSSLEIVYAHLLTHEENVEPTARQYAMASGIRTCCPSMLESPVLGPILHHSYKKIAVSRDVQVLVEQWMLHIRRTYHELTAETVYKHMTRNASNSIISGHTWVRSQLGQYTDPTLQLRRLIQLRKTVSLDSVGTTGSRMKLHNSALELLYTFIDQNLPCIPESYQPVSMDTLILLDTVTD
jgi:hypothetical protein